MSNFCKQLFLWVCFTTSLYTAKWPAHVTFDNEWIVDDSTLRRPPKKKGSIDSMKKLFDPIANKGHSQVHLSESCPAGQLKVCVVLLLIGHIYCKTKHMRKTRVFVSLFVYCFGLATPS